MLCYCVLPSVLSFMDFFSIIIHKSWNIFWPFFFVFVWSFLLPSIVLNAPYTEFTRCVHQMWTPFQYALTVTVRPHRWPYVLLMLMEVRFPPFCPTNFSSFPCAFDFSFPCLVLCVFLHSDPCSIFFKISLNSNSSFVMKSFTSCCHS